jgi:hypothetical protein
MTLVYYLLYKTTVSQPPPTGIVILESRTTDALVWDHLDKAWVYDPELAHEAVFGFENWEKFRAVSRAEAEEATPGITETEPLPDEDTIRWLFHWKGEPPDMDLD